MGKKYRVGIQGHYRDGVLYPPGSIVELPDDEKPSKTFFDLSEDDDQLPPGPNGLAERAKNDRPLPQSPPSTVAFHAQGQRIRQPGEQTIGEKEAEKLQKEGKPVPEGIQRAIHESRVAGDKADEATKKHHRPSDKSPV